MFAGEAASDQAEPFRIGESVSVGETWKARGGKAVFVALFCNRDVGHVAKAEL